MLRDSLADKVGLEDAPVPIGIEVDEGIIPEETSVPLDRVNVGKMPEDTEREALSEIVALSEPVGRGAEMLIEPDTVAEGRIPDD
jgi:hypothetical protein